MSNDCPKCQRRKKIAKNILKKLGILIGILVVVLLVGFAMFGPQLLRMQEAADNGQIQQIEKWMEHGYPISEDCIKAYENDNKITVREYKAMQSKVEKCQDERRALEVSQKVQALIESIQEEPND